VIVDHEQHKIVRTGALCVASPCNQMININHLLDVVKSTVLGSVVEPSRVGFILNSISDPFPKLSATVYVPFFISAPCRDLSGKTSKA
jgi:hypothetical protein